MVTVLLTTYNHAPYVEHALESVAAQDFRDFELIVTDDASTDESAAVARAWLDRTGVPAFFDARTSNGGICAVRNGGLARARGTYVACLSGDDWYEPDRLSRQVAFFQEQADDVAAVCSDVHVVDACGDLIADSYLAETLARQGYPDEWTFDDLQEWPFIPAPGVMLRRAAIEAVGGYDEDLIFEDWDMWLRLADRFRVVRHDAVVANRRELPTSLYFSGYATPRFQRSVARLHAKWLDRDAVSARRAAYWIRRAALVIAQEDQREARALLARVDHVGDDDLRWRLLAAALAVPGTGALVGPARRTAHRVDALVEAERGAWRGAAAPS